MAEEAVKKDEQSKISKAQAEADAALADFLDAFNDLNSNNLGIVDNTAEKQAKMLVAGTKMVGAFTKLGVYKFADLINNIAKKGIQITEDLLSAIKKAYGAFSAENDIEELDDEADRVVKTEERKKKTEAKKNIEKRIKESAEKKKEGTKVKKIVSLEKGDEKNQAQKLIDFLDGTSI